MKKPLTKEHAPKSVDWLSLALLGQSIGLRKTLYGDVAFPREGRRLLIQIELYLGGSNSKMYVEVQHKTKEFKIRN